MMHAVTSQDRSPAVAQLWRYGWMSTALGGFAFAVCTILFCFTQQYEAMTGLALGTIALQFLALAMRFVPAFSAFRAELRDGTVRVDRAREQAAMSKPPLWVTLGLLVLFGIVVVAQILGQSFNAAGIFVFLLVGVILATRGWPTGKTQAQQATGAAAVGMLGLMLSMASGMMAGVYLERSGAIAVPDGVALLGLTALLVVPAGVVFFSTITVIGRAAHAH
ncbi:MAG: hypothetical protein AAFU49_06735 [Pseudomonadota bacterium]